MSIEEMEELEKARTRVRKGRIARIERERVIFTSNQVDIMVSWWYYGEEYHGSIMVVSKGYHEGC